ncbi:MAG: recombinase family protein [Spirochaetota bacterium]|nr:recombinase family protein [Spirochaetota bacterium]
MEQIVGYIRVSTDKQDLNNQRLAILEYARNKNIQITQFVRIKISSKRSTKERKIDEVIQNLRAGDTLIVSELSRIGRSLGQIVNIVDLLAKKGIKFIALKENIFVSGNQDIQTKVTIGLFGLFADIERDLISQRTKQGLLAARLRGKLIGRPKGTTGKSKLDGKEQDIEDLLTKTVSKTSIAKILDVSRSCLDHFIKTRNITPRKALRKR